MNHTIAKVTNIVLGGASLGLAVYNYNEALIYARIDEIFIGVAALCIGEAFISLILSCCCKNNVYGRLDQIVRGIASIALMVVGGLMIYSAIDIENDSEIDIGYGYGSVKIWVQHYEIKIAAGVVAIVNGIVYGSTKRIQKPGKVYDSQPAVALPPYQAQPYHVQQTNIMVPQQPQQQDYNRQYQIPRFQAHQSYNYNNNLPNVPIPPPKPNNYNPNASYYPPPLPNNNNLAYSSSPPPSNNNLSYSPSPPRSNNHLPYASSPPPSNNHLPYSPPPPPPPMQNLNNPPPQITSPHGYEYKTYKNENPYKNSHRPSPSSQQIFSQY